MNELLGTAEAEVSADGKSMSRAFSLGAGAAPGLYAVLVTTPSNSATVGISLVPQVPVVPLAAGGLHTCGLTGAGAAYCWGDNSRGQLGNATAFPAEQPAPTAVSGGLVFSALEAGVLHTCGLTGSGAAYCWGYNRYGQLGNRSTNDQFTPSPVAGGLTFTSLVAGNSHTCGLTGSGVAYCWGLGDRGQLGNGALGTWLIPGRVSGSLTFVMLSAGWSHTCGLTNTGEAYCWGLNNAGQLGNGTGNGSSDFRVAPTAVSGGLSFVGLTAGSDHTCGWTSSGTAYCWGWNGFGQLGDGIGSGRRLMPTAVVGGLSFMTSQMPPTTGIVPVEVTDTFGATNSGSFFGGGEAAVAAIRRSGAGSAYRRMAAIADRHRPPFGLL